MKFIFGVIIVIFILSCDSENSQTDSSNPDNNISEATKDDNISNAIPVEAYIVKRGKIEEKLPFTAVLKPSHSVDIISEASGKIVKIYKELGSAVKTGETLATIDDVVAKSNYEQAKAQVLTAQNNLKIAELNFKSDKQLLENGDISQLAFENSELNVKSAEANHLAALADYSFMQKQFNDTRIKSPISGLVARKYNELGDMISPALPVYRVVDLDIMKLEIGIPQTFISNVEIGDQAEVMVTALKNEKFTGYVKYISPEADAATGSFITEIYVDNKPDHSIKAGMTAKVNLILKTKEQELIIPNHALITKNGEQNVYKINKETAKLIPVTTGESYGSKIIINNGLAEGDTIVEVGMKNLGVETKIWIETFEEN